jgi:hypothetical protein
MSSPVSGAMVDQSLERVVIKTGPRDLSNIVELTCQDDSLWGGRVSLDMRAKAAKNMLTAC